VLSDNITGGALSRSRMVSRSSSTRQGVQHAQTWPRTVPPPPAALNPQLTLPPIWATSPQASRRQTTPDAQSYRGSAAHIFAVRRRCRIGRLRRLPSRQPVPGCPPEPPPDIVPSSCVEVVRRSRDAFGQTRGRLHPPVVPPAGAAETANRGASVWPYVTMPRPGLARARVVLIDEDQGPSGARARSIAGVPTAPRRGHAEPCRPRPGLGDESAGAQFERLASSLGSVALFGTLSPIGRAIRCQRSQMIASC